MYHSNQTLSNTSSEIFKGIGKPIVGTKRPLPEEDAPFYSRRAKHVKLDDSTEDVTNRATKVANWARNIQERRANVNLFLNWEFLHSANFAQADQLRSDAIRMPPKSQLGLPNLTGALCYRSSLMQCLLHLPLFVNWLMDYVLPSHCVSDHQETCFTCLLRQLALAYWRGPASKVASIYGTMHTLLKQQGWTHSGQADPDEMLLFILKRMRAELPSS